MTSDQTFYFFEALKLKMNGLPQDDVAQDIRLLVDRFWLDNVGDQEISFSEIISLAERFILKDNLLEASRGD